MVVIIDNGFHCQHVSIWIAFKFHSERVTHLECSVNKYVKLIFELLNYKKLQESVRDPLTDKYFRLTFDLAILLYWYF